VNRATEGSGLGSAGLGSGSLEFGDVEPAKEPGFGEGLLGATE